MKHSWMLLPMVVALSACGGGSENSQPLEGTTASLLESLSKKPAQPAAMRQAFDAQNTTTVLVRLFQAFYGVAPSNTVLVNYASLASDGGASVAGQLAQDFSGRTDAALATLVLTNLKITSTSLNSTSYTALHTAMTQLFGAYGQGSRGPIVLNLTNLLSDLAGNATYGAAATAYNNQIVANAAYSTTASNTTSSQVRTAAYQSAYNTCYFGTPALYTATYCNAYAAAIEVGASANVANVSGATAASSNVGNIGTGQTVSSTGTPTTTSSTSSSNSSGTSYATSYMGAYQECVFGTPSAYAITYCFAYADSIVAGNPPSLANVAGAAAAGSPVGSVGMGVTATTSTDAHIPKSTTTTSTPYQTAYTDCYMGTPALYSLAYCNAYATAIAGGSSATAANLAGAAAANSNVGNIGTGEPLTPTGTPPPATSPTSSGGTGTSGETTTDTTGSTGTTGTTGACPAGSYSGGNWSVSNILSTATPVACYRGRQYTFGDSNSSRTAACNAARRSDDLSGVSSDISDCYCRSPGTLNSLQVQHLCYIFF